MVVESHVATRTMALSLTGDVPFVGNAPRAMSDLVESCRECNTHLSVVMSVIWQRCVKMDTIIGVSLFIVVMGYASARMLCL